MSTHVLIAEDEPKIAKLLGEYLEAAGMQVSSVDDGAGVESAVRRLEPDALILDLMLPNKDGMSICRDLRTVSTVPIIMLTARVEEIDRLLGLELGADDYVCKPFSPREVVARVNAVLRRARAGTAHPSGSATDIHVDEQRLTATLAGQRLDLTPVEFRLLRTLTRHPGRVYRRDELLDAIYDDYREVSDRTVDSHVKNLRRKLLAVCPERRFIRSVYGVGYAMDDD